MDRWEDWIVFIITCVIGIFGTYFITKFSLLSPRKEGVKEKQFNNLYAPLSVLLSDDHTESSLTFDHIKDKTRDADAIIAKEPLLLHTDIIPLLKSLKEAIQVYEDNQGNEVISQLVFDKYKKFCFRVLLYAERLKRLLGYPALSYGELYKVLDDRTKYVMSNMISVPITCVLGISSLLLMVIGSIRARLVWYRVIIVVLGIVMIVLSIKQFLDWLSIK